MTVGCFEVKTSREPPEPISAVSSSWTILTTCWPGVTDFRTSWPIARSRTLRRELLHDLEVDVGFEQRKADLAHRAGNRLLVERPALPEIAESALQPVAKRVEHGRRSVLTPLGSSDQPEERSSMAQVAKVVRIIGSSPESFAKAADAAVQEAAKTLRGISGAHVVSMRRTSRATGSASTARRWTSRSGSRARDSSSRFRHEAVTDTYDGPR